jgi:hypothetical protein
MLLQRRLLGSRRFRDETTERTREPTLERDGAYRRDTNESGLAFMLRTDKRGRQARSGESSRVSGRFLGGLTALPREPVKADWEAQSSDRTCLQAAGYCTRV